MQSIRVFIVDDNRLFREGLVSMFNDHDDFLVTGSAANGNVALAEIEKTKPDIALIDIGMPEKDGIEVTQALHNDLPDVKVIILGMPDLSDEIMTCIEAGASGYVLKESSFDHLVETIRLAYRGETFCSPKMAASLFSRVAELVANKSPKESVKLTPREIEVISKIAEGLSNKEIAQNLSIETQTVKNHIHNILDKLQLHNRLEAVVYARERDLLKKKQ